MKSIRTCNKSTTKIYILCSMYFLELIQQAENEEEIRLIEKMFEMGLTLETSAYIITRLEQRIITVYHNKTDMQDFIRKSIVEIEIGMERLSEELECLINQHKTMKHK